MTNIIQKRNIWLTISVALMAAGIVSLSLWGLRLGIDFTGGSQLSVEYAQTRPDTGAIGARLVEAGLAEYEISFAGEKGVLIRAKTLSEETHQKILQSLRADDPALTEESFESIGPVIGEELKTKSFWGLIFALCMILLYISITFRKVSYPVSSWKYGAAAIVALLHDLIFVLGVFAALGHFAGVEITSAFIPAFLTVLGFSVHDTIVVFDRVRENLLKYRGTFEEIMNKSLNETIVRSINTSVTVLLVLAAIYVLGGESLKTFSLALILGIGIGTYSSIFFASPILMAWHERFGKKGA